MPRWRAARGPRALDPARGPPRPRLPAGQRLAAVVVYAPARPVIMDLGGFEVERRDLVVQARGERAVRFVDDRDGV